MRKTRKEEGKLGRDGDGREEQDEEEEEDEEEEVGRKGLGSLEG